MDIPKITQELIDELKEHQKDDSDARAALTALQMAYKDNHWTAPTRGIFEAAYSSFIKRINE